MKLSPHFMAYLIFAWKSSNIPGFSVDKKFKLIMLYNRIKFYIIERKERGEKVWSAQRLLAVRCPYVLKIAFKGGDRV